MHDAAMKFTLDAYSEWSTAKVPPRILEIGSFNINGSARQILEQVAESYWGIDVQDGPGVDEVVDAVEYIWPDRYDVIVCNEVFEHTPHYAKIINNAAKSLSVNGIFIATMAGEGRPPHSALDENPIRPWEWYRNIGWWELNQIMGENFAEHEVKQNGTDLYCWGLKRG